MKNFYRALREAWRHWLPLSAAIICSLVAALLWGANIFALFPVIEMTIHGEDLHTLTAKRIASIRDKVHALETHLAAVSLKPKSNPVSAAPSSKRDFIQAQLTAAKINLRSSESLQPWIEAVLPKGTFPTILLILAFVFTATVVKQTFALINVVLISYVSQSIGRDIRLRLFSKAVTLDRTGFNSLGGINCFFGKITQTTESLSQGITAFYGALVAEPLRMISCLTIALMVSWRITLLSMVFTPVMAGLMIWLNRTIRRLARSTMDQATGFRHILLEALNAVGTVQANTMEGYEEGRFRASTEQVRQINVLGSFYNALASPITEIFGMAALCVGIGVSSYLVTSQETSLFGISLASQPMTVAELSIVFGLLIGATEPLRKLSGLISSINSGSAAANFIYPLLDFQSQIVDPAQPKCVSSPHRLIEFKNVTFSYDGANHVLTNVNLLIRRGERLAIVGPNGSGKSTMMSLLCRFFDPQQGAILIDEVDIRDLAIRDLRNRIAVVSQQSEFFNETILHNIRYGCWEAADEEIVAAAKKAKAHDFITEFPDGYQTVVGPNGQRLSGGQRQRIALARALLRNAEILLLDEATSQIDFENETLIHDALLNNSRDRTLIMITHRESTLTLATRIVQFDRGTLTEVAVPQRKAA